jgi:hypothetical protein
MSVNYQFGSDRMCLQCHTWSPQLGHVCASREGGSKILQRATTRQARWLSLRDQEVRTACRQLRSNRLSKLTDQVQSSADLTDIRWTKRSTVSERLMFSNDVHRC